jgi:biotin operon repressor
MANGWHPSMLKKCKLQNEGCLQLYQSLQAYGIPLAEVARQLGVSVSAISKAITRRTKE